MHATCAWFVDVVFAVSQVSPRLRRINAKYRDASVRCILHRNDQGPYLQHHGQEELFLRLPNIHSLEVEPAVAIALSDRGVVAATRSLFPTI